MHGVGKDTPLKQRSLLVVPNSLGIQVHGVVFLVE